MIDINYYIYKIGAICFYYLLGEFILFAIFVQSNKGKSSTVQFRHFWVKLFTGKDLTKYISTIFYALLSFVFLIIAYVLSLSEKTLIIWVQNLTSLDGLRLSLISIILIPFWIAKVELDRKWKHKVVWIPLVLIGLIILSFLLFK